MGWKEGHFWTAEVALQPGAEVEFKVGVMWWVGVGLWVGLWVSQVCAVGGWLGGAAAGHRVGFNLGGCGGKLEIQERA